MSGTYTYTRNALFMDVAFTLCFVYVSIYKNVTMKMYNRHERKKQGKAIEHIQSRTLSYIIIEQKTLSSFGRDSNLHTPGLYVHDIVYSPSLWQLS